MSFSLKQITLTNKLFGQSESITRILSNRKSLVDFRDDDDDDDQYGWRVRLQLLPQFYLFWFCSQINETYDVQSKTLEG